MLNKLIRWWAEICIDVYDIKLKWVWTRTIRWDIYISWVSTQYYTYVEDSNLNTDKYDGVRIDNCNIELRHNKIPYFMKWEVILTQNTLWKS